MIVDYDGLTYFRYYILPMQKEIDLVAVLCNKIAQHLVVEEYVDNERSIREQGLLVHGRYGIR